MRSRLNQPCLSKVAALAIITARAGESWKSVAKTTDGFTGVRPARLHRAVHIILIRELVQIYTGKAAPQRSVQH